jgi:hypothetical protein
LVGQLTGVESRDVWRVQQKVKANVTAGTPLIELVAVVTVRRTVGLA